MILNLFTNKDVSGILFISTLIIINTIYDYIFRSEFKKYFYKKAITITKINFIQFLGSVLGIFFFFCINDNYFFILLATASFLNGLAISLNNGLMPCNSGKYIKMRKALSDVDSEGQLKDYPGYCYADSKTKLAILGDNFYIRPFHAMISIGDIFLLGALFYGIGYEFLKLLKPV